MATEFTPTGLKLAQDPNNQVPGNAIAVPNLTGPATAAAPPFYTMNEPMYFRAAGSGKPAVLLKVTIDRLAQSAVVAPDTVSKFGVVGADIEARRMTWRDRIRNGAKAEVWLAAIACLVAIGAIVSACVTPSAEKDVAKAEFAIQLQPIEQHLATAISTSDPAAVKQAHDELSAALSAHSEASDELSTGLKFFTLLLGAVSAIVAICVAIKRAKSTP